MNAVLILASLIVVGCHLDKDCDNDVASAGVQLEVRPQQAVTNEGCDGVGATVDDAPITYTTGEPVNAAPRAKCLVPTLVAPDRDELYGVRIDFCYAEWGGFKCQGKLVGCGAQSAQVHVGLRFDGTPSVGDPVDVPYYVYVSADPEGDCPRVQCEQEFEATMTRL
ncbi:MAG: hypothetical protein K0R38_835 [Polyangiaceae bacterium]|jgi:hypothetical protein|nr:hypothetical protein [Polyangiaceae bacterium]